MIFVGRPVFSQNPPFNSITLLPIRNEGKPLPVSFLAIKTQVLTGNVVPFLSPNYYAAHLGFFCQQEIKIEKSAKIPFKFRLGSVEDCDKLEGKKRSQ